MSEDLLTLEQQWARGLVDSDEYVRATGREPFVSLAPEFADLSARIFAQAGVVSVVFEPDNENETAVMIVETVDEPVFRLSSVAYGTGPGDDLPLFPEGPWWVARYATKVALDKGYDPVSTAIFMSEDELVSLFSRLRVDRLAELDRREQNEQRYAGAYADWLAGDRSGDAPLPAAYGITIHAAELLRERLDSEVLTDLQVVRADGLLVGDVLPSPGGDAKVTEAFLDPTDPNGRRVILRFRNAEGTEAETVTDVASSWTIRKRRAPEPTGEFDRRTRLGLAALSAFGKPAAILDDPAVVTETLADAVACLRVVAFVHGADWSAVVERADDAFESDAFGEKVTT